VHGDGSFGLNALGLDTAVRHNVPILVVVSLNGGWTADPQRNKPGRNLGYTRFDKMAETLGCYGEYVERPDEIRPALDRAQREVDCGSVGTRASRRLPSRAVRIRSSITRRRMLYQALQSDLGSARTMPIVRTIRPPGEIC
jgi:hypothetical protein